MKKLAVGFILFMFAAVPAFAMKVIVNDTGDRTVPSRSSAWNADMYVQQSYERESASPQDLNRLKLLSNGIRGELVGKIWDYPELRPVDSSKYSQSSYSAANDKLYTREAADYYIQDTINNPSKLSPVGYNE